MRTYADRIEAAAKHHFREATKMISDYKNLLHLGNAMKMREALRGLLEIVCIDCNSSYKVDGKCVKCPRVVAAEAALSARPRNCDLYRTKKELDAAYEKYREYVIMSNSNPFVAKDEMMTKEDWLFAEAKGEAK